MVLNPHMASRNSDPENGKQHIDPRIDELADESFIINQPHKEDNPHYADDISGKNT